MDIGSIVLKVEMNTTDAQRNIDSVKQKVLQMVADIEAAGGDIDKVADKLGDEIRSIFSVPGGATMLKKSLSEIKSGLDENSKAFKSIGDLQTVVQDTYTAVAMYQRALAQNTDTSQGISQSTSEIKQKLEEMMSALVDAGNDIGKVAEQIKEGWVDIFAMPGGVGEAVRTLEGMKQPLDETSESYSALTILQNKLLANIGELNNAVKDGVITQEQYNEAFESSNKTAEQGGDGAKKYKKAAEALAEELAEVTDAIDGNGNVSKKGASEFTKLTRSVSQIIGAFKNTSNPIAAFRSIMSGLNGGIKLTTISFKTLWKTLIANPIIAIIAAVAALAVGLVKLVSSIKSTAEKQAELNAQEKAHLELLQAKTDATKRTYDQAIKGKERELAVLKAGNSSLEEQYEIEDEIYKLKKEKADAALEEWSEEAASVDELNELLLKQKTALQALQEVNSGRKRKDVNADSDYAEAGITVNRRSVEIDGVKITKGSVEDMMEAVQGMVDNTEKKLEMGIKVKEDVDNLTAEAEQTVKKREKDQKDRLATERSITRETAKMRISLINDCYAREVAMAKQANKERKEDLERRLKEEKDLTEEARKQINEQIKLSEKEMNRELARLAQERAQRIVAIQRQIEDAQRTSAPRTSEEQRADLRQTYDRKKEDVTNQIRAGIATGSLSAKEIELLKKLREEYENQYAKEIEILNQKLVLESINVQKDAIALRLEGVREGSAEEFALRQQEIEKEREAALAANKALAEDRQQSEADINAKFDKQQRDLLKGQLEQYLTYEQKRAKIAEEYANEKEKLYKHDNDGNRIQDADGNDVLIDGATIANIEELNRHQREAIQNLMLDFSAMLSTTDVNYRLWLSRIDNATVIELQKLLTATKKTLDETKEKYEGSGKELTDEQKAEIEKLQAMIAELEARIKEADLGPEQNTAKQWAKWGGQIKSLGSEISNLGSIVEGTVGEVLNSIGTMVEAGGEAMEKAAEIAANGVKTVEDASVILALVSSLLTAVKELNKMLEKVGLGGTNPAEQQYLNYLREQNKAVKDLEREYERLGEAISKAYGSDKSKLLTRQIQIAKEQLSKLVEEYEKLRKKQEKYNNRSWYEFWVSDLSEEEKDRLEELGYEIEDREAEIAALRQQAIDAIFGSDIQSAIESFAEAYANAWEKGTSSAETAADYVKQMMKDVVMEAVKQAVVASGKMNDIRRYVGVAVAQMIGGAEGQAILNSLFPMNSFLSWFGLQDPRLAALLQYTPDQLVQMATDTATGIGDIINGIFERTGIFGGDSDTANDRSAQARGVATASQESIDETNGMLTTVTVHTFNISENSNIIRDNTNAILGSVRQIEIYTERLVRMDNDLHNMRIVVNDIQLQGVKIRNS